MTPTPLTSTQSRILGCLLGGAAGDALGNPIEFLTWDQIRARHGAAGGANHPGAASISYPGGAVGECTDDTQMTLFTVQGLLTDPTGETLPSAYLDWYDTQSNRRPMIGVSPLARDAAMRHQRAPGGTCLSALETLRRGGRVDNDSKGCGGVMRAAPAGFVPQAEPEMDWIDAAERTFTLGARAAWITHRHPTGYLSAGVLAVIIRSLLDGASLVQAVQDGLGALDNHAPARVALETHRAVTLAIRLAETGHHTVPYLEQHLGGGWVAEECLAWGIFAALSAHGFDHGIEIAVNHGGDSDSTGAVAGNILGAHLGAHAIAPAWRQVDLYRPIKSMARKAWTAWA